MGNGNEIQRTDATGAAIQSTSEGFGTSQMTRANETASSAVAAQARAQIEARYVIAARNPRDWDNVRTKLLKECQRPRFADVARWSKPVGRDKIEGPSIRFAEAALRCMGNVAPETMVIWDDEEKRIVRVAITDCESNLSYSTDVVVQKTVERSSVKEGQQVLGSRLNSYGKPVYLVRATEDDLLNKQNSAISKALRTAALRILPGDILEECMDLVVKVQQDRDAKDPDAARKAILDAFAKLNIMPSQLAEYVGHDTAQLVPAELIDLRAVFSAIQQGETTWAALMASKKPSDDDKPSAEGQAAQKAVDAVKAKLAAKAAGKQQIVDTTATNVTPGNGALLFEKDYPKWGGKPVAEASAAVVAEYIGKINALLADPKQKATHAALQKHLSDVQDEYERTLAEEAQGQSALDYDKTTGEVRS